MEESNQKEAISPLQDRLSEVPILTKMVIIIVACILFFVSLTTLVFVKNTLFTPYVQKAQIAPTPTLYVTPSRIIPTQIPQATSSVNQTCTSSEDCSGLPCRDGYCVKLDYNQEQTKDTPCPNGTARVCQGDVCQCIAN